MIKAIIFDCFGVLYPNACGNFFTRHRDIFGNDSTYLDELNHQIDLGQITRTEFFTKLEEETGMAANLIQKEIDDELVINQELVQLIKKLKESYKIGILSNAGKEEVAIIYRDQIENLFNTITVSYETQIVKPNKEIYLICTQRLGVEPHECLFIDDNEVNIKAAQDFNMKAILYKGFEDFSHELRGFIPPLSGR